MLRCVSVVCLCVLLLSSASGLLLASGIATCNPSFAERYLRDNCTEFLGPATQSPEHTSTHCLLELRSDSILIVFLAFLDGSCSFLKQLNLTQGDCHLDLQCAAIPNAVCGNETASVGEGSGPNEEYGRVCVCQHGHYQTEDKTACLPFINSPTDPCTEDGQCVRFGDNATCTGGYCAINATATALDGKSAATSILVWVLAAAGIGFLIVGIVAGGIWCWQSRKHNTQKPTGAVPPESVPLNRIYSPD